MATILIVEDELLIAEEIRRMLLRLGHRPLEPVDNSEDAMQALAEHPVELVLMDINIAGDCDGIATALLVRRHYALPVVFLTARSDTPTLQRASIAQPYGYITKPFTEVSLRVQLELALLKAYELPPPRLALADAATPPQPLARPDFASPSMFVRKGPKWVKVLYADILYFVSDQNYVRLHTATEKHTFDCTLKDLQPTLPPYFIRTHRSYLVNLNHVSAYEEGYVQLGKDGGEAVPVSRTYKDELKARVNLMG